MSEFIAAKDLPATEAEEVDVLCVDPNTGEMARKPGASLGGGGGAEPDAVFVISSSVSGTRPTLSTDVVELQSGSMAALRDKILAGAMPNVVFLWQSDDYTSRAWHANTAEYDSYEMQVTISGWYNRRGSVATFYIIIKEDDTISEAGSSNW